MKYSGDKNTKQFWFKTHDNMQFPWVFLQRKADFYYSKRHFIVLLPPGNEFNNIYERFFWSFFASISPGTMVNGT